jgi:hypothetical protein
MTRLIPARLLALGCLLASAALAGPAPAPRPNLVVVISLDQFPAEYLERFRPYFVEGGINRLLTQGANFTDCHYRHAITKTGPGHAVMLTGVQANVHGIIANEWLLREWPTLESVNCVEDRDAPLVGLPPPKVRSPGGILESKAGRSPRHLLAPTIGDQLKEAYGARAKVFGIADKDRAAILMAGRRADGAYWTEQSSIVTSTYYRRELPDYFQAFNAEGRIDRTFGRVWDRLLPAEVYDRVQGPDDAPGEFVGNGMTRTFPKRIDGGLTAVGKEFWDAYDNTPWDNELVADMARAVVINEKLGEADGAPDLLAIGFSQTDRIGHNYGPHSHEIMDSVVRLDRILADFFQFLDQRVGLQHCTLVLTSDHGVAPLPERTPGQGGRVRVADLDVQVNAALDAEFGPLKDGERWAARDGLGYHLNPAALAQKSLTEDRLANAVKAALLKVGSLAEVFTRRELVYPAPLGPIGEAVRLSYYPPRSPDVVAVLKPYFIDRMTPGTTHGTPHDYDTHVPLLWFGVGVTPAVHRERVGVNEIAPTLDRLLGLPALPQADGRPLF